MVVRCFLAGKTTATAADAHVSFHPAFPISYPDPGSPRDGAELSVSCSSHAQILMLSQRAHSSEPVAWLSGGDPEEVNPAATVIHK